MLSTVSRSAKKISLMKSVSSSVARYMSSDSTGKLKHTPLYQFHLENKGRMVPFAGWEMPVQYGDMGLVASHMHTRSSASIFDVSHMLQFRLDGKDRTKFLEKLVVADLQSLKPGDATLSLFTNEKGGIIDDTVITNAGDFIYVVSNAGCADKDLRHIGEHLKNFVSEGGDVKLTILSETNALIALQGPKAAAVLQHHVKDNLANISFMQGAPMLLDGVQCRVTRCGYTGEDGFEISIPNNKAVDVTRALMKNPAVALAGLGARDSLRTEAGLCLYGNDISEDTTPIEATLAWTIGKRRRETGGFLGDSIILKQLKEGVSRKRVGFVVSGAPARGHALIYDATGENVVGEVTSGCPSPSLKKNIAIGYIQTPLAKSGTQVQIAVRQNKQPAVVEKMPFVPTTYYKKL